MLLGSPLVSAPTALEALLEVLGRRRAHDRHEFCGERKAPRGRQGLASQDAALRRPLVEMACCTRCDR